MGEWGGLNPGMVVVGRRVGYFVNGENLQVKSVVRERVKC